MHSAIHLVPFCLHNLLLLSVPLQIFQLTHDIGINSVFSSIVKTVLNVFSVINRLEGLLLFGSRIT